MTKIKKIIIDLEEMDKVMSRMADALQDAQHIMIMLREHRSDDKETKEAHWQVYNALQYYKSVTTNI